ncbi:hypothetical protein EJK55_1293 [Moraxella catarrhalis]|uniref:Uncharacterized protein n=1 Tax=Moraxella catarrhalis TaxID=480 RepID=A0A3Q9GGS9_MORCA|nr:hypothetical protein MCR_1058 [Moraxella catarrhalis BBH18]AZQ87052.1 hypothetical protein EJK52_1108 [Moraxella catarrhalis]EKF83663.1 hypothetical protein MCRH_1131 [Moraxella catarrhalis RH4]AZQ89189.1 hypothetical protein EJK50_1161 [Moraxella catarrhalis]AZQ90375.1 hypothetical protein EJK51_1106 [Moraxella catarrhalis]
MVNISSPNPCTNTLKIRQYFSTKCPKNVGNHGFYLGGQIKTSQSISQI